ncbi:MAG: D-alanine--D-alanine ligase [Deltaproteobacteria bacterium]|nr:D-alanine--D-alanine ligase [Deltaproteobacteria bacterium]
MKIGLTYDLRSEYLRAGYGEEETAEFDREDTVEALERSLLELGHETERIGHARALVERLARGDRWDLVFNIAEGLLGEARESQVPAILDVFGIPYTFSDPLVLAVCLRKDLAKLVVAKSGVATPAFEVVTSSGHRVSPSMSVPLFLKPVAEGTSKGIGPSSIVRTPGAIQGVFADLLARFRQPVLVESFLEGREFTVGIVGTGERARVLGSLEVLLLETAEAGVYSYLNKKAFEGRVEYRLGRSDLDEEVRAAESVALAAWRALGCRDGGRVDVRSDGHGVPHFIEANPLAGLNPEISDLAIMARLLDVSYTSLIREILESALTRIEHTGDARSVADSGVTRETPKGGHEVRRADRGPS